MEGFDPKVITWALAASALVKVVIDVIKMATEAPQWVPPAIALAGGVVFVLVIMLAEGHDPTVALLAQAVIAGVLAGGMSVGATALQNRTKPSTDAHMTVSVPVIREPRMTSSVSDELLTTIAELSPERSLDILRNERHRLRPTERGL
jgi:hypothetical protein